MERFALNIFTKRSIIDLWQGSEIASAMVINRLSNVYLKLIYQFLFVSCNTWNTHKPVINQPNRPQTTQKPAKPLTNSQISDKPPQNQSIMTRNFFYITKNFSNNAKHVLNLQPFYSISSTFSNDDQSQVGIERKWREIM